MYYIAVVAPRLTLVIFCRLISDYVCFRLVQVPYWAAVWNLWWPLLSKLLLNVLVIEFQKSSNSGWSC